MSWLRRRARTARPEDAAPALPPPERLRSQVETAAGLPALSDARTFLLRLVDDYARSLALADRPLRVALVGSTGAGKSTLLNALAGTVLAKEGVDRPTSSEAVAYAPLDAELGGLGAAVPRVVRYLPDAAGWAGQVLVDTPDLNSIARENAGAALAVLEHVDAALLVFHRGSVAEARPAEALRPFARRRALACAINFADVLGPGAREDLRAQVRRVVATELGGPDSGATATDVPVFVVSALKARLGEALDDDWEALRDFLRGLADAGQATELRTRNARAVLGQVRSEVAEALARTEAARVAVREALERGLAEAGVALREDFDRRLEAAAAHLGQSVRRQAAARLSGPVGWGLRLSGWGSGGLAGAALAAQASVPAGLLVAATGAVLDEVQARGRSEAAERVLTSGADGAVDALARTALAPARTAAAAAGLGPVSSGLPEHAAWTARLAAARTLAWREVSGPALSAAVARWWRWARLLLVPLVQLPLLALVGHVGWRVARAYWEGAWLPGSYFLNAAVLAGAWTVAGTAVAALSLAGVARGVRGEGRDAFSRAWEAAAVELRGEVDGALAGPRAAAAALLASGESAHGGPGEPARS